MIKTLEAFFAMAYGILYDYLMGQCTRAYEYFGAHFGYQEHEVEELVKSPSGKGRPKKVVKKERIYGVWFRLYAPMADDVSVIGEWNGWDVGANKMPKIDDSGVFETFVPGLHDYQSYKFHFRNAHMYLIHHSSSNPERSTAADTLPERRFSTALSIMASVL